MNLLTIKFKFHCDKLIKNNWTFKLMHKDRALKNLTVEKYSSMK